MVDQPTEAAESPEGNSCLRTCLVLSVVLVVVLVALFKWASYGYETQYRNGPWKCQNNLKHIGLTGKMYANEAAHQYFPELSNQPGTLAMRSGLTPTPVYPEFLTDLTILQCPLSLNAPHWYLPRPKLPPVTSVEDDRSYFYLGYYVPDQETLERFARAYRAHLATGAPFAGDLPDPDAPETLVRRLREDGIPEAAALDGSEAAIWQSTTPLFIERFPNAHTPEGGNVLYMDGHAEWIKLGAKWPMTQEAIDVLMELDVLGDADR